MNYLSALLLIMFSLGCRPKEQNDNLTNLTIEEPTIVNADSSSFDEFARVPIDIVKLKSEISATSGVVTHSKTKDYCSIETNGFYGFYFLIGGTQDEPFGKLTVYVKDGSANWKYDNDYEEFVAIELNQGNVRLWDKIRIGLTEKELLDIISTRFHYKKGTFIYAELGDFKCNFGIQGDTISELSVTQNCNK